MQLNLKLAEYLHRVALGLEGGSLNLKDRSITDVCPECAQPVEEWCYTDEHIWGEAVNGDKIVILGCEGYWVVDPLVVGLSRDQWQPVDAT